MFGLAPETLAILATAVTTAVMQYAVWRTDLHRTEAHDLRDRADDLEKERDEWRQKYYDLRDGKG